MAPESWIRLCVFVCVCVCVCVCMCVCVCVCVCARAVRVLKRQRHSELYIQHVTTQNNFENEYLGKVLDVAIGLLLNPDPKP